MPFITAIQVDRCRNVSELTIDLPMDGSGLPRHLVLTGPNGSGKSGILHALAEEVGLNVQGSHHPVQDYEATLGLQRKMLSTTAPGDQREAIERNIDNLEKFVATTRLVRPVKLAWSCSMRELSKEFAEGRFITVYVNAKRAFTPEQISGPTTMSWEANKMTPHLGTANQFLQFLVNKKTEQAFAHADRDESTANRIAEWFDHFDGHLKRIFQEPNLRVEFDRPAFNFRFTRPDGYTFDLRTLADGHASLLAILAEILLRTDAMERLTGERINSPKGVVVIDEVEAHLHLSLQEQILPFLTSLFPDLQFIIATHSPVIITSIPRAMVLDLKTRRIESSDDLRGVRFGDLMTGHFGLPDDVDLDSVKLLERFRELAKVGRDEQQEVEFVSLAANLAARSASLALEVWMITNGKFGAQGLNS